MTTSYEQIIYEVDGRILTITLNRPDKLNAYTRTMQNEIIDALDRADEDDIIRAIIFTGAGRGYCAGADLSSGGNTFDYDARGVEIAEEGHRDGGGVLSLRLFASRKPLICAVNGPAVGVGVTMQLPMDIRLASDKAKFGFVFARRGISPEACSTYFLPRIVGISKAAEWIYTGRVFEAQEAAAAGLVSEVVPHDGLLDRARELANEIADNTSAVSVALSRAMLWHMLGASHPMEAHRVESLGILNLGMSKDAKEGVTAFLEKRPAQFTDSPVKDMPGFYPWWEEPSFSGK